MNKVSSTIILITTLVISGCARDPVEVSRDKPEIVEVFACSDYCPGPREQYLKQVYDGIIDEDECRKLGGQPYTYIGWGEHTVCVAE